MDFQKLSDGQLAATFADIGSDLAFEELIRRHGPMVFRTCRRVLGNYQDAEDAMQQTFAALAVKADGLRKYRSLGGWLYSTAWHIARHVQRSRQVRHKHEARVPPRLAVADVELDDHALCELYRAIEMLPTEYRDAIVLHHLEGLTVEQVAGVIMCSVGTIASRLSRGRAMIRQRLTERELLWSSGVITWVLSAPWLTDGEPVPAIVVPDVAESPPAIPMPIGAVTASATIAKPATITILGLTISKLAVACLACFAVTTTTGVVVYTKSKPQHTVLQTSGSASASAKNDAAGEETEPPANTKTVFASARGYPTPAVPEPTILAPAAIALLALRRRR